MREYLVSCLNLEKYKENELLLNMVREKKLYNPT